MSNLRFGLVVLGLAVFSSVVRPDEKDKATERPPLKTAEQIAEAVRQSVVVITVEGRDGKRFGLGSGFVVSADGLIATNLHVIDEARPIQVQLADGSKHEVTTVHATNRVQDLAIIRIAARDLTPLELGDSDQLKDGQPIVAVGNPRGLTHSVVVGVVSGRREVDGRQMIQLAVPIEQGNSGGPFFDMHGRVQGLLTIKSLVTANLGFAVPINALKPLLHKPNPIPMARWLTIGALDPEEWKPLFGARWRQRAGHIHVDGQGTGFGGRSLCLYQRPLPAMPFEVAVSVKLDDESGAAGLVFHADGGDKHYGFYPTGGKLRLTRFEGADVFTWKILKDEPSPHYRPGEWNTIKVRIEKDKLRCFVNDHLQFESDDTGLAPGQVGLAKFRHTKAEFKNFRVAREIPPDAVPAELMKRLAGRLQDLVPDGPPAPRLVDSLAPEGPQAVAALRQRAQLLEAQAAHLRRLAQAVHQKRVQDELLKVLSVREDQIDLLHAALLIARLDNDELDVDLYRREVERMAREAVRDLPGDADDKTKLAALVKYLFHERGFHGSRGDYYNRSNSYLNEVIDDREGLPITLSVLFMELGRRLGLKIEGVPLPGHFVVRHVPAKGDPQLIDVYEGGQMMSLGDAEKKVQNLAGRPLNEDDLRPADKKAILVRMLNNLLRLAGEDRDLEGALRYLDAILTIAPDSAQERWMRAVLRLQSNRKEGARDDADWLLRHEPPGIDLDRVRQLRRLAEEGS